MGSFSKLIGPLSGSDTSLQITNPQHLDSMKAEDARFAHLKKDPRFKKLGKDQRKVKIDNRFKHMFTAPEFSSVDFLDSRYIVIVVVRVVVRRNIKRVAFFMIYWYRFWLMLFPCLSFLI